MHNIIKNKAKYTKIYIKYSGNPGGLWLPDWALGSQDLPEVRSRSRSGGWAQATGINFVFFQVVAGSPSKILTLI